MSSTSNPSILLSSTNDRPAYVLLSVKIEKQTNVRVVVVATAGGVDVGGTVVDVVAVLGATVVVVVVVVDGTTVVLVVVVVVAKEKTEKREISIFNDNIRIHAIINSTNFISL